MFRMGSLAGLVAFTFSAARGASAQDIRVEHMEVTQGIQDLNNSVPLVTGRSAAVRVRVGNKTQPDQELDNITGALEVLVDGLPIAGSPFPPINAPLKAPKRVDFNLDWEQHTLNFELTSRSFLEIPAGVPVEFSVTVGFAPGAALSDPDLKNNTATAGPLVFMEWRLRPTFFYVLIDYRPPPKVLGLPDPALVAPGQGEALVRGVLPVRDQDPNLYRSYPLLDPATGILFDAHDGGGTINGGSAESRLFDVLEILRLVLADLYSLTDEETFLFGWLPEKAIQGANGLSFGRTGFGTAGPLWFQRTFAHELGHQLGICEHDDRHISDLGDPAAPLNPNALPGWDIGARLWDNPPANGVKTSDKNSNIGAQGHVKYLSRYDLMATGKGTPYTWVDVKTYKDLLTPKEMNCPAAAGAPAPAADAAPEDRIVVRGCLCLARNRVEELYPVLRFAGRQGAAARPGGGKYLLEVTGDCGQPAVTKRFDVRPPVERDQPGVCTDGYFSVWVPFKAEGVRKIRILEAESQQVVPGGEREVSPGGAPEVKITSPKADSTLGGPASLEWSFTDAAGTARPVQQAIVAFSPDGGRSWKVLGGGISDQKLRLDAKKLPRADKTGRFRIIASDGLNTSVAEVGGLSVP